MVRTAAVGATLPHFCQVELDAGSPLATPQERVKDDFAAWLLWMRDITDTSTGSTWFTWNKGQLEKARNEGNTQVGRGRGASAARPVRLRRCTTRRAGPQTSSQAAQGRASAACAAPVAAGSPGRRVSAPLQTNPWGTALRGVIGAIPTALLIVASITKLQNTRYDRWAAASWTRPVNGRAWVVNVSADGGGGEQDQLTAGMQLWMPRHFSKVWMPPALTAAHAAPGPVGRWIVFGVLSGGFWLSMLTVVLLRALLLRHYQYRTWRLARTLVAAGILAFLVRLHAGG